MSQTPNLSEDTRNSILAAARDDTGRKLAAEDYLGASFSAAHLLVLARQATWTSHEQEKMLDALAEEARVQLDAGNENRAAWRFAYMRLLGCTTLPFDSESLAQAVLPAGRDWTRIAQVGRAADFYLLTREAPWTEEELSEMLSTVERDLQGQLTSNDSVMAADRLALFDILASSLG